MSRIDEALARARHHLPEPASSMPAPGTADVESAFPVESEPAASAALHVASVIATPEQPLEPEPPVKLVPGPSSLGDLILAEKLMVGPIETRCLEQYRRLATRLYLAHSESRTRVVMVTSALAGEGKTLSAANLALTLSESYRRQVLLIDADLRRPFLHQVFQVANIGGLNDGLRAETERKVPLIRLSEHLTLLTAGRPDPDPMSVLSSDRIRTVINEASERFEWIIVDTPPIGLLSDAHLLAQLVDAVLLVIHAGATPLAPIRSAVETLGRDRIMGVILNQAEQALSADKYDYYYGPSRATA